MIKRVAILLPLFVIAALIMIIIAIRLPFCIYTYIDFYHKYPLGMKFQDAIKMGRVYKVYDGPKSLKEIGKINSYYPERELYLNEKLVIVNGSIFDSYLLYFKDNQLIYKSRAPT